jgi:hypothetical protein
LGLRLEAYKALRTPVLALFKYPLHITVIELGSMTMKSAFGMEIEAD